MAAEQASDAKANWEWLQGQKPDVIALALVEACVCNTRMDSLFFGEYPASKTGDYSDVKVVTPYGEIPWTEMSRIAEPEMMALLVETVDRVFTFLQHPENLARLGASKYWKEPRLDPVLMRRARRRAGKRTSA